MSSETAWAIAGAVIGLSVGCVVVTLWCMLCIRKGWWW